MRLIDTWEYELYGLTGGTFLADISTNDVSFFVANDKCYIMDQASFKVYDGTTINDITP